MDTDSDSDGSHISATPPREPNPSPPRRPPLPTRSSTKSIRSIQSSSRSKPKKPPLKPAKLPSKPLQAPIEHSVEAPPPPPATVSSPFSSSLPFQIRRGNYRSPAVNATDSLDALPAPFFLKASSLSRARKHSLNFENDEPIIKPESNAPTTRPVTESSNCSEPCQVPSDPALEAKINRENLIGVNTVAPPDPAILAKRRRVNLVGVNTVVPSDPAIVAKRKRDDLVGVNPVAPPDPAIVAKRKHLNLVGANTVAPPVKIRKCGGNEGNFVKLNLNGKRRGKFGNKFKSKFKGKTNYSHRRTYSKRKPKGENEAEADEGCDEQELVAEITQQKEGEKCDVGLVEEKASAARNDTSDENLARLLNVVYGYNSFRDGQLEAIRRILSGKSTMLVLPTGAGKSLCYQIPAMLLPGITLVVSPLVALMIDQLKHLPAMIPGGLLSSSQNPNEVAETLRQVREGMIKVLFVSPERFMNESFLSLFSTNLLVSLVVVDEAHCISEWSHNFRPSYMRLRASLLRTKINAECILAMTATATTTTLQDVMCALEIPSTSIIQKGQLRENLHLSVSLSANRMKDLLTLIKSPPFNEVKSIIIYCKFQFETDMISRQLRDNSISAKSYHSGLLSKDRSRVQDMFCSNKIRVVVATVAFGMGLDKGDVGAVIHYTLPESLEEYVQEIGRAGRDGRSSFCHLFFDDATYFKLRSLMYSDGVDEYAINKLLSQVFSVDVNLRGKNYSLVKESASRQLDMKEEVILTLLTRLELGEVQYLRLLPQLNVTCTLNFYKTSPELLAKRDTMVATLVKKSEIKDGQYVFNIPSLANTIGITSNEILKHLQDLKFKGEITYELKNPAYCYTIVEVPQDLCSLTVQLTKWLSEVEICKVRKFDVMFDAAVFAVNVCDKSQGCCGDQHTHCLQRKTLNYFNGDDNCEVPRKAGQISPFLRADIKVFLQSNSHAKFTPRAVARIMHGLPSPAYPSAVWSKTHFWGRYMQVDFPAIMEVAKTELMSYAGKDVL